MSQKYKPMFTTEEKWTQLNQKLAEEFSNAKALVAKIDPRTDWIHVSNEGDLRHTDDFKSTLKYLNVREYAKVIDLYDSGRLSDSEFADKMQAGVFNIHDGIQDLAINRLSEVNAAVAGGEIAPEDNTGIEVANLAAGIFAKTEKRYSLPDILTKIPNEKTSYEYLVKTGRMRMQRNFTYGNEILNKQISHTTVKKELKCDVLGIGMFSSVPYRNLPINVWRENLDEVAMTYIRDTAEQVYDLLNSSTVTEIASADWGTSTTNPYLEVTKILKTIEQNDGYADTGAMNDIGLSVLFGNPNRKSDLMTSKSDAVGAKILTENLFNGISRIAIDNLLHNQKFIVWEGAAVPYIQGVSGAAQYNNIERFSQGYVAYDWKLMFIKDLNRIIRIKDINTVA